METSKENFKIQKMITTVVVILFLGKLLAWYFTNSVAILTDTLEYTINVVAGFIGLYSLYLSSLPKDKNHPYGHGKVEFLSASIEGTLMVVSGGVIIYEAINNLKHPHEIKQLDYGIYLVAFTAVINFLVGAFSVKRGKKNNSMALIATGKHMQSDTYATIGIVIGLILMYFTHFLWIDSVVAFIFSIIIIISGYKILRTSIAGIMDEADEALLSEVVEYFQEIRHENWVDLHNLRIIKYGGTLHLDCHVTVPWFINIKQGHDEILELDQLIKQKFNDRIEVFVHTDPCNEFSCKICSKIQCPKRQKEFIKKLDWTVENITADFKHTL